MTILFISDLHLSAQEPARNQIFFDFLKTMGNDIEALYILGDLFEVWLGDDDRSIFAQHITNALKQCTETGTKLFVMRGNRDFFLGQGFAERTGCQLLTDHHLLDLYGTPTLLMHGDLLCTDDVAYLKARLKTNNPEWQQWALAKPLWLRRWVARYYRYRSKKHTAGSDLAILDANEDEVARVMIEHGVKLLIHGHTHRPGIQCYAKDEEWRQRIVLSDWGDFGNVLACEPNGSRCLYNF